METDKTIIEGEHTTAIVYIPPDEIEENCKKQIQEMVNHPAFQEKVVIQPDAHVGKGSVIGFTMHLKDRVCPNTVGVDVGCGMFSFKLADFPFNIENKDELVELDSRIRDTIPMGQSVHKSTNYHVVNDFPWKDFSRKWENFAKNNLSEINEFGKYNPDDFEPGVTYFKDLCSRVGYNINRAINSVGTLGGGNHFIEFALDSDSNVWCTIHSGSRGLGKAIAEYHQERAKKLRRIEIIKSCINIIDNDLLKYVKFDIKNVNDDDLLHWIQGGKGESFIDYEKLKNEYENTNPEKIEEISERLKLISKSVNNTKQLQEEIDTEIPENEYLNYLEGSEAIEYYVDMAFGQTYASESRKLMAQLIVNELNTEIVSKIESVHNYIDYTDGIIRKGATPAREGQLGIIPINMSDGSFIVKGKGNEEWNFSAPHGAGRTMGRREAKDKLKTEEFEKEMKGIVATELPLDEAPSAYKNMKFIKQQMKPTVEFIDHLEPFMNLKAN